MPTTITFRRGTAAPTSGSGLTLGEPAFDSSLNRLYVGLGTGITAAWVGAGVCGASSGIAAGITYQIPTLAAVKNYVTDYVSITTSGVASFNGLTGAVQGVSAAVAGTGISVSSATGSVTITNIGVQSFNGNTGAVTGASLGANTFTGLQTLNAGLTTSFIYASTGSTFNSTLQVNGGATFAGRVDVGGTFKTVGDAQIGDASTDTLTVSAGTTFNNRTDFAGNNNFATGLTSSGQINQTGNIQFRGSTAKSIQTSAATLTITGITSGVVMTGANSIAFGVQTSDPLTLYSATGIVNISTTMAGTNPSLPGIKISTDDAALTTGSVTLQPTTYLTAARTQYLQDANGTLALTSQLMGAVNGSTAATTAVTSFNGLTGAVQGVSAAVAGTGISVSGATGSVTITNIGVQSFNGNTGAVTGASLGANTFTGLQTLNAGLTTQFIYASIGSTFGSSLQVNGAFAAGATATITGAVLANGGLTASTLDVSGAARLASTLAVTGVLTQTGGATFASTTDHTGAARFASTITATGAVTANGGLTASSINVSGTLATTGDVTVGATLTVSGNLQVNGTTTTINSTTLVVDDKLIELAHSPSGTTGNDAAVDGGGIQLNSTQGNKTFTWVDSTDSWTSNQNLDLSSTYTYKIAGTTVLSSSALGSGVTGSSLTQVGTISSGTWQGTAVGVTYGGTGLSSYTTGDILYASNTGTLAKLPASTSGYLLASTGAGAAPEYKQLLVRDADANSIITSATGTGTLTLTIQNATNSLKGVAKFDATNFTVTSGNVTVTGIDGGTY